MTNSLKSQQGIAPLLIVGIVALVLLAGGGIYYASRPVPGTPITPTTRDTQTIPTGEVSTNINDLLNKGQAMECDWHSPAGPTANDTGKLWTDGTRGRSAITTNIASGLSMDANALYTKGDMYSWMNINGTKMGFKIARKEGEEMNDTMTAEQKKQAEQYRQEMVFNCRAWTVDPSKFVLPTDVTFEER